MVGSSFGKWTVVSFSHVGKKYRKFYNCICACGYTGVINGYSLQSGNTKSCGCGEQSGRTRIKYNADVPVGARTIYQKYKCSAKARGLEFSIPIEVFKELMDKPCAYCGTAHTNRLTKSSVSFYYNGIDRVDSSLGYTEDNAVTCCFVCNRSKSTLSKEEFISWIMKVHDNLNLQYKGGGVC